MIILRWTLDCFESIHVIKYSVLALNLRQFDQHGHRNLFLTQLPRIPRSFIVLTLWSGSRPMVYSCVIGNRFFVIGIMEHLLVFNSNLLVKHHWYTVSDNLRESRPTHRALSRRLKSDTQHYIPLKYHWWRLRTARGPKLDPCGTPKSQPQSLLICNHCTARTEYARQG